MTVNGILVLPRDWSGTMPTKAILVTCLQTCHPLDFHHLTLKKRRFKQGTINQLKTSDSDLIFWDKEILAEWISFYQKLYTSRKNECHSTKIYSFRQLTRKEVNKNKQKIFEGLRTNRECTEVLKTWIQEKPQGQTDFPPSSTKFFG